MNFRKSMVLSIALVAFSVPGISSATSSWHGPKGGESGGDLIRPVSESTTTRAQVMKELEVARQDGTLPTNTELKRNYPANAKSFGSAKTRAEVQNELLTLTTEQKQQMRTLYRGRG